MVKVLINGVEVNECPVGWQDFTTTLRIDPELRLFMELADTPLTFLHEGYRLLKAAFDANGYCFSYPIQVLREDETGQYLPIFDGTLFFKDIEWQEGVEGYSAKCQLTDDSFFAKIYNNRNIKAKIYVPRSKSDVAITYASYGRIRFFAPSTGTYYSHLTGAGYERNDVGFRVYDVLRFLVAYMSDGEVDFISDFFSVGGVGEGAMITCGIVPRFTSGAIGTGLTVELFEENFPDLSFAEVFKELDKVYNLGIVAGYNGAAPFIRIEELAYLRPNTTLQNMPNVEQLKRKTALEYLYAKLLIGSTTTIDESFLSYIGSLRLVGWNEEEYVLVQGCNTDRELNLVNDWIIDSNTIEDNLINPTTAPQSNDNKIMLINCIYDISSDRDAVQSNWLIDPPPPYYYNELYNNENKLQRYLGGIPAPIAAYLNTDADRFLVSTTATYGIPGPPLIHDPVPFDDDSTLPNFDSGGNFDPTATNYDYTVPVTSIFSFVFNGRLMILASQRLIVRMECWDATYTTLKSGALIYDDTPPVGVLDFVNSFATFYAEITDKIKLTITIDTGGAADLYLGATWECTSVGANGGIFADYDPRDYPIIRNQFDYPMSFSEFRALKANPLGLLSFGVANSKTYFAWIEEVKYKHFQPQSSFTLISNEKIN